MRELYLRPKERLAIFEWQHTCADFPKIVREGLEGIRKDIAASRERWSGDVERLEYLRGMELALSFVRQPSEDKVETTFMFNRTGEVCGVVRTKVMGPGGRVKSSEERDLATPVTKQSGVCL